MSQESLDILQAAGLGASNAFGAAAYAAAAFSALFSLTGVWAARKFWLRRRESAGRPASYFPPVTIFKPLKGLDPEMYENLASFLSQDYPEFQVLFCLQDPGDPALAVLHRLRKDFPRADMEIVVSSSRIGYNPKVNNLANAYSFARHQVLVVSDSDVRVGPDFLGRLVAPLKDPEVGAVTCFYRGAGGKGLGPSLDSLSVNAQFLPQALTAAFCGGMRFAMGAVMAIRRQALDATGGLANLSHHIADDFWLGQSLTAAGYRLEFSDALVDSLPDTGSLGQLFDHQVRWAKTIRVCNPAGYAGSVLLHGAPLLALYAALADRPLRALAAWALLSLLRMAAVARIHRAYLDHPAILRDLALLPLSDLLHFFAWLSGLSSRTVLWRGENYWIAPGGRLIPTEPRFSLPAGA